MRQVLRLLLFGLVCLISPAQGICAADNLRVLVVLSDSQALYQNFANTFKQNLPTNIQVSVAERVESFPSGGLTADLIVTVGVKAAESVAGRTAIPILAAMFPSHRYTELLAKRPPAAQTSAIYLDHSWARQVELMRATLPGRRRIGVLYSSATRLDLNELRKQLEIHGATLIARQNASPASLFDDLEDILSRSDVLLAVPDSDIYNSNNIRNILLTSYRHNIPLVGISQAYVNAGALCALFSTPEQLAAQASTIAAAFALKRSLPEAQFPALFSIAVNQEVARTLGGTIKPAELLRLEIDKSQRTAQ
ncbi:MAG: hypothetical protein NTY41_12290 [Proteobacteria bacterium]|nr:hypothetical protein [Pseudomonadota bacterium]